MHRPVKHHWLLIVGLLLSSFTLYAQKPVRLTGQVTTLVRQALPGANVLLRKPDADSTIVAFALADSSGRYRIEWVPDTSHYLVSVQLLGYAARSIPLLLQPDKTEYEQSAALTPQSITLNEVIVNARVLPIRARKDTVIYNARSFADGSERSVEDLLKKLPGVAVSSDGTITVKGKAIDKVLVEGEDLFGRSYKLISRSMAANLLDKVEAIENFTDNPLLHNVGRSGKTILNLTIREERKKIVFGNAAVQGGTGPRYEGKGSLFSLLGRVKLAVVGDANNIGTDPLPDAEYGLLSDEPTPPTVAEQITARPLLQPQSAEIPPLDAERFTFNRARLAALSATC